MSSFNSDKQVDTAIFVFSKAFDTVPHKKLLHKLEQHGIMVPLHVWLTTFLTNRSMPAVLEGTSSEATSTDFGVPHKTVLGPLPFLCHTSDLPKAMSSQVCLFTNDCLL